MANRIEKVVVCTSEIGGSLSGSAHGAIKLATWLSDNYQTLKIKFPPANNKISKPQIFNAKYLQEIKLNLSNAYHTVFGCLDVEDFSTLLILSADHSNSIAGISALSDKFKNQKCGIIWIDAHADIHTPYTTPSGNFHGMPIAAILGLDNKENEVNQVDLELHNEWQTFKDIGRTNKFPKILPQNLVYISLRDTESQEEIAINNHNLKIYSPKDINAKGVEVAYDTLEKLKDCDFIYLSFDIDSLDENLVPGTGTPVKDGLTLKQASDILDVFIKSNKIKIIEFSEFNSVLDIEDKTFEIIKKLLSEVLGENDDF